MGVGIFVGSFVGSFVGMFVGMFVGIFVGIFVGSFVGMLVGIAVGMPVGIFVGIYVGAKEAPCGNIVGMNVGAFVGIGVGCCTTSGVSTTVAVAPAACWISSFLLLRSSSSLFASVSAWDASAAVCLMSRVAVVFGANVCSVTTL